MDINITLIGQMITFAIFIWFTMKFVWPPLVKAMEERRKKLADGLADADKAKKELELAEIKVREQMEAAKQQAAGIIEQATHRGNHIVEEAKEKARAESERIINLAQAEIDQAYQMASDELMQQVTGIAVKGAQKIIEKDIDVASNDKLIEELIREVKSKS